MSRVQDIICMLRALRLIAEAGIKLTEDNVRLIWKNSSIRAIVEDINTQKKDLFQPKNISELTGTAREGIDRVATVLHGLKVYTDYAVKKEQPSRKSDSYRESIVEKVYHTKPNPQNIKVHTDNLVITTPDFKIKLTEGDKELLKRLDMEYRAKLTKQEDREKAYKKELEKENVATSPKVTAVPNPKSKQKLCDNAKQRKVPSSRIGRMVSFGTLAAGLGLGTATEYAKRTFGIGDQPVDANVFMNKANMDRIVDTLCKVRGAALKLGQIMSIQDESLVNPELAKALERVRKSADFMPNWQVEEVMCGELGLSWKENFTEFEERPFAAASIGQVHRAVLKNGQEVAIKIQYPGVARGIESDINNLGAIMKMWNIFPKGMFLENLMAVAKRELAWEVDYVREAQCTKKFKQVLAGYNNYYVPNVIDELSTKQVFTTEMLDGIPVDQCFDLELEHREFIGEKIMELCLIEILKFRYMQTDPNWANFLYSPTKKQILLLDFGASREYSKEFMDKYVKILKGACDSDRETVLKVSRELGFLTGYESKIMEDAHVDAVMILGEVFRHGDKYDFANQDMTVRIQNLAQTMLVHRLCPPPEEVYSLHRKLSGVFLLCTKLKVSIPCRDKFMKLYNEYVQENNL
ncbi:hypothetical protein NQ315_007558 [Exocentrus adspersus]|uniref:ABC1 atypical kinase-like domain-containing protein n=1 Tax=Exocentrus adspersus TaxID=1586481 RepID=A0AAV8W7X7_9CUCU|nr:hypothetical protein NQ315_007558 [Exocentrus adspersus]